MATTDNLGLLDNDFSQYCYSIFLSIWYTAGFEASDKKYYEFVWQEISMTRSINKSFASHIWINIQNQNHALPLFIPFSDF